MEPLNKGHAPLEPAILPFVERLSLAFRGDYLYFVERFVFLWSACVNYRKFHTVQFSGVGEGGAGGGATPPPPPPPPLLDMIAP